MQQMGGINELMAALPGGNKLGKINVDEKQLLHTKAIIQSMTVKERKNPQIINASRRKRIAAGSGTSVTEVNKLLNGFNQAKKMMKRFTTGNKRKHSKMNFPFM